MDYLFSLVESHPRGRALIYWRFQTPSHTGLWLNDEQLKLDFVKVYKYRLQCNLLCSSFMFYENDESSEKIKEM